LPSLLAQQDLFDAVRQSMHPQNLSALPDTVSKSWIILPRAYRSLARHHCRYLPLYLRMINEASNEQSLGKWIRIVIEFTANYSVKFADATYPKEKIRDFVVNGYEALFWRNLKSPPEGYENILIFEHFLNWMKYTGSGSISLDMAEPTAIERMKAMMLHVFPSDNVFRSRADNGQDASRFQIALRHGRLGINATANHFWIGPLLNGGNGDEELEYKQPLIVLGSLFRLIERDFCLESERTRYYIEDFLYQLETAYKKKEHFTHDLDGKPRDDLQFLTRRLLSMIQKLSRALQGRLGGKN
jgi:hypothetical protein